MKMNLLNSAYLFNNADRYIDNVARKYPTLSDTKAMRLMR